MPRQTKKQREKDRELYGPDLHEGTGDPFADPKAMRDEPLSPELKAEAYRKLESGIANAPRGPFTDGKLGYDPDDEMTWFYSEDEEEKALYRMKYGDQPPEDLTDGLSMPLKKAAWEAGSREIEAMTLARLDQADEDGDALEEVWQLWTARNPVLAADEHGSRSALIATVQRLGGPDKARKFYKKFPKETLELMADSFYQVETRQNVIRDIQRGPEDQSTQVSYGGSRPGPVAEGDQPDGDGFAALRDLQRKGGWF